MRRPARLLVVSDSAPERNGVGAYYSDLLEHLEPRLERVGLVAPDPAAGPLRGSFPMPGDRTQRLALPSVRGLVRAFREQRPTAVVLPTPGPYALLGLSLARRSGADVLVGFHTHYEALTDLYWNNAIGRASRLTLETCNRLLFRYASRVLVNSGEMEQVARAAGAGRVERVGTPIPRAFVSTPAPPVRERVRRVLFAGRLAPEKNLEQLVAAAEALPELEFRVAGDGPLRGWLEAAAGRLPNLRLLGWLDRSQLIRAIDACDAVVLPSHVESFGTIALEALARGRGVVVSARCGILDWPVLAPALHALAPEEPLSRGLRRLADEGLASRERRSRLARVGSRRIVQDNLDGWLELLDRRG